MGGEEKGDNTQRLRADATGKGVAAGVKGEHMYWYDRSRVKKSGVPG